VNSGGRWLHLQHRVGNKIQVLCRVSNVRRTAAARRKQQKRDDGVRLRHSFAARRARCTRSYAPHGSPTYHPEGGLHLNNSVGCARRPPQMAKGAVDRLKEKAIAWRRPRRNRRAELHFGPPAHFCGPRRCILSDSTASSSAERRWEGTRPTPCRLPQYQQRVQRRSGRRWSAFKRSEPPDGRS
jgi:hypothetical protein